MPERLNVRAAGIKNELSRPFGGRSADALSHRLRTMADKKARPTMFRNAGAELASADLDSPVRGSPEGPPSNPRRSGVAIEAPATAELTARGAAA